MYDSIHNKLYKLPDDCIVCPCHDYMGRTESSIGEEKRSTSRVNKPLEEFIHIMNNLGLAKPKKLDESIPANIVCGI